MVLIITHGSFYNMEGWVKLYRRSLEHWLYVEKRPLTRREAWEDILLLVNHEESKVLLQGTLVECKRGQSLQSLNTWADHFRWSVQKVRTFFKLLENDNMIITEGLQKTTRLTVCNYDKYQGETTDKQQTDNRQTTDKQQTNNRQITTNKNTVKNTVKNDKKINIYKIIPPSIELIKKRIEEREITSFTAEAFHAHYSANGWLVGKNKMKDWDAALTYWKTNSKNQVNGFNKQDNSRNIKRVNRLWD
jgi:hypothetical protein